MRQPDQNQPASKEVWVGRFKAFCDGWFEEVGVSPSFHSRPFVNRPTADLLRPFLPGPLSPVAAQLDIDHPVNVVEGDNVIVIQVSRTVVARSLRAFASLSACDRALNPSHLSRHLSSPRRASSSRAGRTTRSISASSDSTRTRRSSDSMRSVTFLPVCRVSPSPIVDKSTDRLLSWVLGGMDCSGSTLRTR